MKLDGRRCNLCGRPASLYGFWNRETGQEGWCLVCRQFNGQDYIIRSVSTHPVWMPWQIRRRIIVFMTGFVRDSLPVRRAERSKWDWTLFGIRRTYTTGGEPDSDSDSNYEEFHNGTARCWRPFLNRLHCLAFAWDARELLLDFLGDFEYWPSPEGTTSEEDITSELPPPAKRRRHL